MNVRHRALMALVSVFLFGCLVGAGSLYLWLGKARARDANRYGGHEHGRLKLSEILQLSQEQEARYKVIMNESRQQFEAARAEADPKFQAIRLEMRKRIFAILNDEQKKKFEAFLAEKDARRKHLDEHK